MCVCVCVFLCVCVCVCMCVWGGGLRACLRACVPACVPACVRCVCVCVCVCLCVRARDLQRTNETKKGIPQNNGKSSFKYIGRFSISRNGVTHTNRNTRFLQINEQTNTEETNTPTELPYVRLLQETCDISGYKSCL